MPPILLTSRWCTDMICEYGSRQANIFKFTLSCGRVVKIELAILLYVESEAVVRAESSAQDGGLESWGLLIEGEAPVKSIKLIRV